MIQTSKQNCNKNRSIALSNFICLKNQASFIDQLAGWRNWIAHLTTDQEVPGSSPGSVDTFVFYIVVFFLRGVCDWYFHCTCTNCCDTVHQFYIVSLYSSVYVDVHVPVCVEEWMKMNMHLIYFMYMYIVHVCMSEAQQVLPRLPLLFVSVKVWKPLHWRFIIAYLPHLVHRSIGRLA